MTNGEDQEETSKDEFWDVSVIREMEIINVTMQESNWHWFEVSFIDELLSIEEELTPRQTQVLGEIKDGHLPRYYEKNHKNRKYEAELPTGYAECIVNLHDKFSDRVNAYSEFNKIASEYKKQTGNHD